MSREYWHAFPTIEEIGRERRALIMRELPKHTEPETIMKDKWLREAIECFGLHIEYPTYIIDRDSPYEHIDYWRISDRLYATITPWVSVESLLKRIEIRDYCLSRRNDGTIYRRESKRRWCDP